MRDAIPPTVVNGLVNLCGTFNGLDALDAKGFAGMIMGLASDCGGGGSTGSDVLMGLGIGEKPPPDPCTLKLFRACSA